MPVSPDCPAPLRKALEAMEDRIQYFKGNIPYAAPETWDLHYGLLQEDLAEIFIALFEETTSPTVRDNA